MHKQRRLYDDYHSAEWCPSEPIGTLSQSGENRLLRATCSSSTIVTTLLAQRTIVCQKTVWALDASTVVHQHKQRGACGNCASCAFSCCRYCDWLKRAVCNWRLRSILVFPRVALHPRPPRPPPTMREILPCFDVDPLGAPAQISAGSDEHVALSGCTMAVKPNGCERPPSRPRNVVTVDSAVRSDM